MRRWSNSAACAALALAAASPALAGACRGTVYLTIDTGSMSQAQRIADILDKHAVPATFFLANEKTVHGDYSLDEGWRDYWRQLAGRGHAFGSHTFDHVYFRKGDQGRQSVGVASQGPQQGRARLYDEKSFCTELDRVKWRFFELTGHKLDPFWRAPGGYTTKNTLAWGERCGYRHVGWTPAGFLGDELPSEKYSNAQLLEQSLARIGPGDILIMHTGIWSRREAYAPALDLLIAGLKQKGLCFATLRELAQLTHN
ncbi:MAG: polysaccharide deacetylase family protein [Rhodocyclaceae bacterium]|nr:polysaccharide deacetylase family protein [Rhodocyclaceae bacterium]